MKGTYPCGEGHSRKGEVFPFIVRAGKHPLQRVGRRRPTRKGCLLMTREFEWQPATGPC
jgi:hypothetical protein